MNGDILPRVIAEWVRGAELPTLTPRERPRPDLAPPPVRSLPSSAPAGPEKPIFSIN